MKKDKTIIIFIIIIIIVAVLSGICKIMTSYMIEEDYKKETKIEDGGNDLIKYLNKIENEEERKERVEWYLEANKITEEEAKEILGE